MKVHIVYNGCQMRGLDAARLHHYFKHNHAEIVDDPRNADFIIFVSCAVNERAVNHSVDLISRYHSVKNNKLIVIGCFPAIIPDKLKKIFNGPAIRLRQLNEIDKLFPQFNIKYSDVPECSALLNNRADDIKADISTGIFKPVVNRAFLKFLASRNRFEETAVLKISDGCNNNCAYCNIKKAIGPFRSRPVDEIIHTYEENQKKGIKRFVFIGDDTGGYGQDCHTDLNYLLSLLQQHESSRKIQWLFDEVHPHWLLKYEELFTALSRKRKMTHLICPLQSGSQRIVDRMNRPYKIDKTIALLEKLRNFKTEIHTHIIVGFPTESDEDFEQTLELFSGNKIFRHTLVSWYYEFPNTPAYHIHPKVSYHEKKKRTEKLLKLLDAKRISYFLA